MSAAATRLGLRQHRSARATGTRLSRDDWLEAAFSAAADQGFGAVRVLTLARRLGVTRGSFYWHFENQAALVDALVTRWRDQELQIHTQWRLGITAEPRADLLRLLDFALSRASAADHRELRFGLALRALGRSNPTVARTIVEIDEARHELFNSEFMRLLGDPAEARQRAVVFYLAIAGAIQALARGSTRKRDARSVRDAIAGQLLRSL